MDNFTAHHIETTIVKNLEDKVSVTNTSEYLSQIGADNFLSKADFIRTVFLPAMEMLNNGYNLDCVCYAAKVLAKMTAQ
jgi:hypothetical protein